MSIEAAISLFAAVGLGSILGAFFQSRFEQEKQIKEQEHDLKHRRIRGYSHSLAHQTRSQKGACKDTRN